MTDSTFNKARKIIADKRREHSILHETNLMSNSDVTDVIKLGIQLEILSELKQLNIHIKNLKP